MGKATEGASTQKRGSKQKKKTKEIDVYMSIFIDDFESGMKLSDESKTAPLGESTLALFYALYKGTKKKGVKCLPPKYIKSGAYQSSYITMQKSEIKDFDDLAATTAIGAGNSHSTTYNIKYATSYIREQVVKLGNTNPVNLHIDLFGSGRGAFAARTVAFLINPDGKYKITERMKKVFGFKFEELLPLHADDASSIIKSKEIRCLGLFDTLNCVGVPNDDKLESMIKQTSYGPISGTDIRNCRHNTNVDDFGLYATESAKNVLQISALDEFRKFFPLVDVSSGNATEIFLPGSHNDICGATHHGSFLSRNSQPLEEIFHDLIDTETKKISEYNEKITNLLVAAQRVEAQWEPPLDWSFKSHMQLEESIDETLFSVDLNLNYKEHIDVFVSNENTDDPELCRKRLLLSAQNQDANQESFQELYKRLSDELVMQKEKRDDNFDLQKSKEAANQLIKEVEWLQEYITHVMDMAALTRRSALSIIKRTKGIGNKADATVRRLEREALKICESIIRRVEIDVPIYEKEVLCCDHIKEWLENAGNYAFGIDAPGVVMSLKPAHKKPSEKELEPISCLTYKRLGWMQERDDKEIYDSKFKYAYCFENNEEGKGASAQEISLIFMLPYAMYGVHLSKPAEPGYSFIPMKLMWDWCNSVEKGIMNAFPDKYKIPKELDPLYKLAKSKINAGGQHVCVANNTNDGERVLRRKYLQFAVHDPSPRFAFSSDAAEFDTDSFNKKCVVARRIYKGKQGGNSGKKHYTYDLGLLESSVGLNLNPKNNDLWIMCNPDGSDSDFQKKRDAEKRKRQEEENF